ncbi:tyrosine-type recombinase/integrase [Robbsia sp. Bb-Pol-6]|uniref:Tyrosine-type recombinase/integrase n=1 Tax=Robbsia betulipollinis TaxID=2981849 RepID=A0ABT3ZHR6_9BURK|nr:tyrosine-type recombinase/integrase [Robbsia betulipollinis]MCY0385875.1 tyrosine-type recombinase/integrase [Robbsia betulipollinis]
MHSDLFNQSSADWAVDPRRTFDAWLASRHFRGSSADVYRAQFNHFLDWLGERGKTLMSTEPSLIDEFVGTLDVKRQQRARYLRIMERVFDDMFQEAATAGNPARPVARSVDAPWTDTRSNAPTGFLSDGERDRLWRELARAVEEDVTAMADAADGKDAAHAPAGKGRADPRQPMHWRDVRDRALAALMLGCGLKLSEAETLTWRCVLTGDARVLVEAADPRYSRYVPVPPLALHIVERWFAARALAEVGGDLVFPAGRGGKPMHKATVLRAIDELVARAGLLGVRTARISPQTLRNAYAATLFEAGEPDELLAERLGFAQLVSSRRLRTAWLDWQRATARNAAIRLAVAQANEGG